ncbi:MAG: TauD/TfdA family dioxygenase [Gammaproteobacteria bacterium]|nr:TauD/TfdA family dioxygenase [Gammaproteobacteria bacterium]
MKPATKPKHQVDYERWRRQKLAAYENTPSLVTALANPFDITEDEYSKILTNIKQFNMALYATDCGGVEDDNIPRQIGRRFGLENLDRHLCAEESGIAALRFNPDQLHGEYIPYSRRAINWHTDGYYNNPEQRINAMILQCVSTAESGGENAVMDPEILYILLRDENPSYIDALSRNNVMTIPANEQDGKVIREAQTGPVFYSDEAGNLHMRYTARTRSIEWLDDPMVKKATTRITQILNDPRSPYIFRFRMKPGQGIICNNVLHMRTAFEDNTRTGQHRLVYRARYYDRVRIE